MNFLEKYALLKKSIPVQAVSVRSSVDCEYADIAVSCKNCYYCFDCYKLEGGMYTNFGWGNKLVDCRSVIESEKCYQSADCNKCHSSTYLFDCNSSTDCHFSAFLNSCANCFGCVGLTHKKFCILNTQYTKEKYQEKLEELKKENPDKLIKQMLDLKQKIPHPASQQFNSENCPYGDYMYDSKNCYWGFLINYSENSGYIYESGTMKNCWDVFFSGGNYSQKTFSERCYENVNTDTCYDSVFLKDSENCTNCYYSENILNCSDCFGCVGLKNKKYCVLNNQLTKDQFTQAQKEIKKELGWRI